VAEIGSNRCAERSDARRGNTSSCGGLLPT
jgi:hypothetical protein